MRKYYVEISREDSENIYEMQSKWFDTIDQARVFAQSFEYIVAGYNITIMGADWDESEDTYVDIDLVECIK